MDDERWLVEWGIKFLTTPALERQQVNGNGERPQRGGGNGPASIYGPSVVMAEQLQWATGADALGPSSIWKRNKEGRELKPMASDWSDRFVAPTHPTHV